MSVHVVIMAGGRGERFWPLSRADRPKQFITLLPGGQSLFRETCLRAAASFGWGSIYVVTGERYLSTVRSQVPEVQPHQILIEPIGRDTGPCLALASALVASRDPNATLLALPSDHYVRDKEEYGHTLNSMVKVASATGGIVTAGVFPDRPETGFGYMLRGEQISLSESRVDAWRVERFVEKPPVSIALTMLDEGRWFWNSGMFAFEATRFLDLYAELIPHDSVSVQRLVSAFRSRGPDVPPLADYRDAFMDLSKVSVDHGIMEKAAIVTMVSACFGWDDLGSWPAMSRVHSVDEKGNVVIGGRPYLVDTSNSIFYGLGSSKPVAIFGLNDAVAVDSGDVLFITTRAHSLELKRFMHAMREIGLDSILEVAPTAFPDSGAWTAFEPEGKRVDKPWGYEIWWAQTDKYVGKVLSVRRGEALSLQYHERKCETMLGLSGRGHIWINDQVLDFERGTVVTVHPGEVHRIVADTDVSLVEVSTPEVDDVVRLSDNYGRIRTK